MAQELWPCGTCGAPGIRNLGTEGYCAQHLGELYGRFDPAVLALGGIGLPGRSTNPHDLTCTACGATWAGVPGEACQWCYRRHQHQIEYQGELLLTPPDQITDATIKAWAIRLAVAVKAGIIDEATARRAITNAEHRAA